jgi:hypothetical protein
MAGHCSYDHQWICLALPTILSSSNPRIGLSCRRLCPGSLIRSKISILMIFLFVASIGGVMGRGSPLVMILLRDTSHSTSGGCGITCFVEEEQQQHRFVCEMGKERWRCFLQEYERELCSCYLSAKERE